MKYIKAFESDNWQPWDAVFQKKFGISKDFLMDILCVVRDEFPDMYIWIDDAESSHLVKPDNNNIFVIYFEEDVETLKKKNLYGLEKFLYSNIIDELRSQIKPYDLKIYTCDFGETDTVYEIVICKKGAKVIDKIEYSSRYR